MVSKEDWAAVTSSEIFREYLNNELLKEAKQVAPITLDTKKVLEEFASLEQKIKETPSLKLAFLKLQETFSTNPEYRKKVNAKFADAVMLLNLGDEK